MLFPRKDEVLEIHRRLIEQFVCAMDCGRGFMIANDQELQTTLDRIAWFQQQVAHLRRTETNPENYRAAASGFLAEIDRMQLEVREYLNVLPTETVGQAR